ncbi:hypothetical protein FN846DRAFT_891637 [Sphaerosporella brunnea]|uniref:Uncharacterized protein n=1 Tax=Sphaerosporella brunnea TaxID=1250544 RepID=A0A5J5ESU9_9PEZI|nr:hypothetical protein FN846DRAFT_891637 [Sphaerosporella brunnea]
MSNISTTKLAVPPHPAWAAVLCCLHPMPQPAEPPFHGHTIVGHARQAGHGGFGSRSSHIRNYLKPQRSVKRNTCKSTPLSSTSPLSAGWFLVNAGVQRRWGSRACHLQSLHHTLIKEAGEAQIDSHEHNLVIKMRLKKVQNATANDANVAKMEPNGGYTQLRSVLMRQPTRVIGRHPEEDSEHCRGDRGKEGGTPAGAGNI